MAKKPEITQEHINSAIIGLWHQSHDLKLIALIMEMDEKEVERIINDRLKNENPISYRRKAR